MKFIDSEGLRTIWGIIKSKFLPLSGGEMENSASIVIADGPADPEGDRQGVRIDNTGFFVGNLGDDGTQHVYVTSSGIKTESSRPNEVFTTDGNTAYLKTINGQEIYGDDMGDTNIEISVSGDYLPTSGGSVSGNVYVNALLTVEDGAEARIRGNELALNYDEDNEVLLNAGGLSFYEDLETVAMRYSAEGIQAKDGTPSQFFAADGTIRDLSQTFLPLNGVAAPPVANSAINIVPDSTTFNYNVNFKNVGNTVALLSLGTNGRTDQNGSVGQIMLRDYEEANTMQILPTDIRKNGESIIAEALTEEEVEAVLI